MSPTTPLSDARKRPKQARARSTIGCIVEGARQVLAAGQPLTTNTVAVRAGVSVGTLYQYFANKYEILQALLAADLPDLARRCPPPATPGDALISAQALMTWAFAPAHHAAWRLLDDAARHRLHLKMQRELLATAWPDSAPRPWAITVGVVGAVGLLTFWMRQPARPANTTPLELAALLLAPHIWPVDAWRAACDLDPSHLGEPSVWSAGIAPPVRPLRRWLRVQPSQGRSAASVAAVISAAGNLLEQGLEYSVDRLAERAGVSVSTIYRYFADKHFAIGEFGVGQLARFTEQVLAQRAGIYLDAPGAGVSRLVLLGLDPLRSRASRALRRAMVEHGEKRIIDQQIQTLQRLLWPTVAQHPLCAIEAHHLGWVLHAIDGVAVWQCAQGGLRDDPVAFGQLTEAAAQMVFNYCAADRTRLPAVLGATRPLSDLRAPPG